VMLALCSCSYILLLLSLYCCFLSNKYNDDDGDDDDNISTENILLTEGNLYKVCY